MGKSSKSGCDISKYNRFIRDNYCSAIFSPNLFLLALAKLSIRRCGVSSLRTCALNSKYL